MTTTDLEDVQRRLDAARDAAFDARNAPHRQRHDQDEVTVAGHDRRADDAAVDEARTRLEEVLAADPVTQALAAVIAAQSRAASRALAHRDALHRLGRHEEWVRAAGNLPDDRRPDLEQLRLDVAVRLAATDRE